MYAWATCLKANHSSPAALCEHAPGLDRIVAEPWEAQVKGAVEEPDISGQQHVALSVQTCDTRMLVLTGAVDKLSFPYLVVAVLPSQLHHSEDMVVCLSERNLLALTQTGSHVGGDRQGDGY